MEQWIDQKHSIKQVIKKVNAAVDAPALFPDVAKHERATAGTLFRYLEKKNRLPKRWAEALRDIVDEDVTLRARVTVHEGRASLLVEPKFKTPNAQLAYVFLWLSQQGVTGVKVKTCKRHRCGKLFLCEQSGRGRPREFCSYDCGNAFNQARQRAIPEEEKQQRRKDRAAKHNELTKEHRDGNTKSGSF